MKKTYSSPQKKVSILLSCYNASNLIKDYIDFLLHPEIIEICTLIAVNFPFSHSDPQLVIDELKRYPDIILINSEKNVSLYDAWNIAIKKASTQYVSNLNLDDRVTNDYYSYGVIQLQEINADIFSTFAIRTSIIGIESEDAKKQTHLDYQRFINSDTIKYDITDLISISKERIIKKSIPHCAPIWKRTLHDELGYFNSKRFDFCADIEFWLRAAAAQKAFIVSCEYKTLFYCATGTASDRLMHSENSQILERWRPTFPPPGYIETHLGKQHDLLHHCMNMNVIFSSEKYYQHLENEPVFEKVKQNAWKIINYQPNKEKSTIKSNQKSLKMINHSRLSQFKNIYKEQNCILMCNGPSLSRVDFSAIDKKKFVFFGLNKVYLGYELFGFYPDYMVSINKKVIEQSKDEFSKLPVIKFISNRVDKDLVAEGPYNYHINTVNLPDNHKRFSKDICKYVYEGWTVTHAALQIIYYMGFKEVYIVGMDHRFSQHVPGLENRESVIAGDDIDHFHPRYFGHGQSWDLPDLKNSEISYKAALDAYRQDNRKIYDCTINGKCDVFPKLPVSILYENSSRKQTNAKTKPLVSIVVTLHNAAHSIMHTVNSIYQQGIDDIEIILVDDSSTDETWHMMSLLASQDVRIHTMSNKYKKGTNGARNTAIEAVKGSYVAFLDTEWSYNENALSLCIHALSNLNNNHFAYSMASIKNTECDVFTEVVDIQASASNIKTQKNNVSLNTMLIPASLIKPQIFNEVSSQSEDWSFITKLLKKRATPHYVHNAGAFCMTKSMTGKITESKVHTQDNSNNTKPFRKAYDTTNIICAGSTTQTGDKYLLKPPVEVNWLAFRHDKSVVKGESIHAQLSFHSNTDCTIRLMMCRDGKTPFESKTKKISIKKGNQFFELSQTFNQAHSGIRIQISVYDKPIEISKLDSAIMYLPSQRKPIFLTRLLSWIKEKYDNFTKVEN